MPAKKKPGPSVKDPEVYEKVRDEGGSKEKAARIANASAGARPILGGKEGCPVRLIRRLDGRRFTKARQGLRPIRLLRQEQVAAGVDVAQSLMSCADRGRSNYGTDSPAEFSAVALSRRTCRSDVANDPESDRDSLESHRSCRDPPKRRSAACRSRM